MNSHLRSGSGPDPIVDPDALIRHYGLAPHPEGGWYARTYCSGGLIPESALPDGFRGGRPYSTAVLYLLEAGQKSLMHRIRQDELWHFYLGGPLRLAAIKPDGDYDDVVLGSNPLKGQLVQFAVSAGSWFGAMPMPSSAFSFVGCTVSPGFDFEDFELGRQEALCAEYPMYSRLICEFTRNSLP